jgi:peptide-methionine (S)-S-oxide reductase
MSGLSSPTTLARLAATAAMVLATVAPVLANPPVPDGKAYKPPETMHGPQTAVFAGGCFWGVDAVFKHVKGVSEVESGYAGGAASAANYEQVSGGATGHAEAVRIRFNPAQVSYQQLLQVFFQVAHDPTQLNRQGPDVGSQYRSAIFYTSADQQKLASAYIQQVTDGRSFSRPIVTQVVPLHQFYRAEEHHQNYLALHPNQPYIVFNDMPKLAQLRQQFPVLYK